MKGADSNDVSFEEIGPQHCADLVHFFEENNVEQVLRTFHPFSLTAATAERIACAPRRDHYYAALLDGAIVGMSMLRGWDEGYAVPSFGIFIDHRFHGRGLGSRLLDYTLQAAGASGCARVRLSVYAGNAVGIHLYASRGFTEESRQAVTVQGRPDEKIVMAKNLP